MINLKKILEFRTYSKLQNSIKSKDNEPLWMEASVVINKKNLKDKYLVTVFRFCKMKSNRKNLFIIYLKAT